MVYTPVAPTAPFAPVPAPAQRRRRHWPVALVAVLALVADVVAAVVFRVSSTTTELQGAYTPAFDRTLEHAGGSSPLTSDQIDKIASNAGIFVFSKFSEGWNLQNQFAAARKLVAAGKAHGNDIAVYEYFSSSFWFDNNETGWGQYASTFKTSWYLDDDKGQPVAFHGIGKSASNSDDPVAHMLDLSNPAYRAWAVATLVAWAKAAPIKGINMDAASPLVGNASRAPVGDGTSTYNEILCGSSAQTDCPRVKAWNQGLADLLSEVTAALRPLGLQVAYNGVQNSTFPADERNSYLLADADMANNEDFCLKANALNPARVTYMPVQPDIDMMVAQNAAGKKLTEITNYQTASKEDEGPFCLGAFLMGWQPDMDYFSFHQNYGDPLDGAYPKFPEINLNLGAPTGKYQDSGDGVMTRTFARGFVAINDGKSDASVTLPRSAVEYSDGKPAVAATSDTTLEPRQARFFLWSTCVPGPTGGSPSC